MLPEPEIVLLTLVSTLAPAAPKRKFWVLLDRVRVPPPVRVTLPFISRNVLLPTEFSCMAPLLVMVPASVVVVLFWTAYVPELVTPLRFAVPTPWMSPPPLVVRVPLLTVTPLCRFTREPAPTALMVPPVLV